MSYSRISISAQTARQILSAAKQNGVTVENYLQEIARHKESANVKVRAAKIKYDFAASEKWLRENRHRYIGKWIVLNGGELIGAGESPVEIVAAARAKGVAVPFVQFIVDESEPFTGGWL